MGYQTVHHGSVGLSCGLQQFMSHTEGKYCQMVALTFPCLVPLNHHPYTPPTRPPPIDAIHDITAAEKTI